MAVFFSIMTALGAVCTFAFGVYQFSANYRLQAEARRLEARRPFLDRQLALYKSALETAARITTLPPGEEADKAKGQFWQLYWGELALVEDTRVEKAMVDFGRALKDPKTTPKDQAGLTLALAHACRISLAESWHVPDWQVPWVAATKNQQPESADIWAKARRWLAAGMLPGAQPAPSSGTTAPPDGDSIMQVTPVNSSQKSES